MWKSVSVWILCSTVLLPPPASSQIRSDFNSSGAVDFGDFILFAAAFGSSDPEFNLDSSGSVDFADFLVFATDYAAGPKAPHWLAYDLDIRPPGRRDHTLTLDKKRDRVILFGGKRDNVLDDTWIFDLEQLKWRSVRLTRTPGARRGHTAIYDPDRDRVIIFGGETDSGFLNDVWAFDLENEAWAFVATSGPEPVSRYGLGAVLDAPRDRMIISHGFSAVGRFKDTWSLDLAAHRWLELGPVGDAVPQERCLHSVTIDPERESIYLFGGCSSGVGPCPRGDLWSYDPGEQRWTDLTPSGSRPTDRSNPSLVYDAGAGRMLLFGGADQRGTNDTWSFTPSEGEWTRLEPTGELPPVRWSQSAVFDLRRNRLLIFGGTDGAVWHDDLWELRF